MLLANRSLALSTRLVAALALTVAAATLAVFAKSTPAHADTTCGDAQVCVWSQTNYTGTKTTYTFAELAALGCRNVSFRSLKIGAGTLTTTVTQYGEENCFAGGLREDTTSLLGTPTGNPEVNFLTTQFTAHSFSFLQVGP